MTDKATNSKVVVGVDGSAGSLPALAWALRQAEGGRREVVAVYAWQVPALAYSAPGYIPPEKESLDVEGKRILAEALKALGVNAESAAVSLSVGNGLAADVIADVCEEAGAEMAVVGSRGHGRIAEILLGSTSRSLLQKSKVPLVIVPAGGDSPGDGRIVVGVDGSVGSKLALEWAITEASTVGGNVEAVMVIPAPSPDLPPQLPEPLRNRAGEDSPAAGQLAKLVDEAVSVAPSVSGKVIETVLHGNPAHTLRLHANGADMLVVGRRGLGSIHEAFSGSVSSWCSHHTNRPVVVVPTRVESKADE
ncbi:MAG: universal stress protein [Acidimicrobiales bacterium]